MSKLADALRARRIFNVYELVRKFGDERKDIWIQYSSGEGTWTIRGARVHSPSHDVDPTAREWGAKGKVFYGNRAESVPEAKDWANERYGVRDWAPSPFGGAWVPLVVLERAKEFVKSGGGA